MSLDELGTQTNIRLDYRLRFAANKIESNPHAVPLSLKLLTSTEVKASQSDPFARWPHVLEGFVQLLRTVA